MDLKIKEVRAYPIKDSRGNPTVEVELSSNKFSVKAAVPSGASTGIYEAHELRDKDGRGVNLAVKNVNRTIRGYMIGEDVTNQSAIDKMLIDLDGTRNKRRLGANAILGVSLAAARLRAKVLGKSLYASLGKSTVLPIPFMNIINGGRHANNGLCFQEFMIVPRFKTFKESLSGGISVYNELKQIIGRRYGRSGLILGDEGGFAPHVKDQYEALDLIVKAIDKLGYSKNVKIAMDCAASEFYKTNIFGKSYYYVNGKKLEYHKLVEIYEKLLSEYPIVSIEDPFAQDNFSEFSRFKKDFGRKAQIVGDDLLVTNISRIHKAIEYDACNGLLLKVNQIGTLTEAIGAAKLAMSQKWGVMVSHRSGETMDPFISDLAVGIGTGQIKSGAPNKPERLAKYNRLVAIEKELGSKARMGSL
ncbi:MAG: phosphopyruvate hydratase [Candidatus Woesearchaeota archaeon]